jgi:hypothetical protein
MSSRLGHYRRSELFPYFQLKKKYKESQTERDERVDQRERFLMRNFFQIQRERQERERQERVGRLLTLRSYIRKR